MDTSRSVDPGRSWQAGAQLFSGRSDPVWPLTPEQLQRLLEIWEGLHPAAASQLSLGTLGFRGCFISDGAGHVWSTNGQIVTFSGDGGADARSDPERCFEREILASAPAGTLPEGLG